jgi:hypothetical protein
MPRGVALGEVIANEALGLRGLQELQPLLVELIRGRRAAVNPIEQAKSHVSHRCPLCMVLVFRHPRVQQPSHETAHEGRALQVRLVLDNLRQALLICKGWRSRHSPRA